MFFPGGNIADCTEVKIDFNLVAVRDPLCSFRAFKDREPYIDRIPVKDPRKGYRDNARDAGTSFIAIGACSLEEPRTKFLPAIIMSPFCTRVTKVLS
jgi:hypothetical protein